MSHAFISYARENKDFVVRLHDALEAAGEPAWVDWQDIPPSARWMDEISRAIVNADAFVFVISPVGGVENVRMGDLICRGEQQTHHPDPLRAR